MKNTTMRLGIIFFVIATVLMSIAAVIEATAKEQDSVSGLMILAGYAQAPWSFFPPFNFLSGHISDFFFKLNESTSTSYVVTILITGFCWSLNGVFIGLGVELFKVNGENGRANAS